MGSSALTKYAKRLSSLSSILGLLVLFTVCSIISRDVFLSFSNLSNVLRQVTVLGFAALGMTLVILTGNIDLSVIGNVSLTTVITAVLLNMGCSIPVTFVLTLMAGAAIGLMNGLIISYWKVEAFVITLGMQVFCMGLALYFSGGRTVIVQNLHPFMMNLASARLAGIPVMFLVLLCIYIVTALFMKSTKMGRYIYGLGGNEEVCYISGINVSLVRITVFVIAGFTSAIAGIFTFSRSLCGDPSAGNALGMYVIAAVIIGGTKFSGGKGNVMLTIVGLCIIGIINNFLNIIGAPYYTQQMIQGLIIITAVIISSQKRR